MQGLAKLLVSQAGNWSEVTWSFVAENMPVSSCGA
jgi:hypothetical protein